MQNGIPDNFYSSKGGILFAEYKYVTRIPKRASTLIIPHCSKLQLQWLARRYGENVPVCVILGSPNGAYIFTDLTWVDGIYRDKLTLTRKQVSEWIIKQVSID